jgi:DNA uptake protein ComE-like DNA-binding protein
LFAVTTRRYDERSETTPRRVRTSGVVTTGPPPQPRSRWPWLSLLPFGCGAWVPIYAGVRARVASWIVLGIVWSVIAVAGWAIANGSKHSGLAGFLIIVAWVGAAATTFVIRSAYDRRMASPLLNATERAEERLSERRHAQEIAHQNPSLALEMGIGRPDLKGSTDAGVVDINNAPAAAIAALPGVDDALATRIVETRAEVGGFSSVEDLGIALDLAPETVEDLRDRVVFLPR